MMAWASPTASTVPLSLPIMPRPPRGAARRGALALWHQPGCGRARLASSRHDLRWRAAQRRRPHPGARAVAGMAQGNRQGVGLIGAPDLAARQQEAHHGRDLSLFAVAGAG